MTRWYVHLSSPFPALCTGLTLPQSKKKAKKAKAKQPKQANPDDAADQTEKEGNKRALEDRDGPTPKKKKAKVESPPEDVQASEQLLSESADRGEKPAETPVAKPSEDVEMTSGTPVSAKKNKKGKKEAAVESPAPANTPKVKAVEEPAKTTPAAGTPSKTPKKGKKQAAVETPAAAPTPKAQKADEPSKPTPTVDTSAETPANPTPAADAQSDVSMTSEPQSPTFDEPAQKPADGEAASSTSSVTSGNSSNKPKHIKIPEDTAAFRERFAERLASLRAARKADGADGKPARTRQELLEQRREKQAQRKEHKKEMRRVAKLEEEAQREEALKAASPTVMSPGDELDENTANFSFGRVNFGDGAQLSHDLSYVLNRDSKKGPSDPKTALLKLQNQKKRLAGLDAEKRKDIEEKEAWLTARRRAEGEKIRDDEAVLKKSIKRKERGKKKSEKEWRDRKTAVEMGIKARQKKRTENLQKRRDEKGKGGKKKGAGKKKSRPGFEGKFGGKK